MSICIANVVMHRNNLNFIKIKRVYNYFNLAYIAMCKNMSLTCGRIYTAKQSLKKVSFIPRA